MRFLFCMLQALMIMGFVAQATPSHAADTDPAILAAVDRAIAAINSGSEAEGKEAFTEAPLAITDDFPPFVWSGEDAFKDYSRDLKAILKQLKIENWRFQRHAPRYVGATADAASVVVPASFPFTIEGKPGSVAGDYTFILKKVSGNWKVDLANYGATHHTLIP